MSARLQSPKVRLAYRVAAYKVWELSEAEMQPLNKGPYPKVENGILNHCLRFL